MHIRRIFIVSINYQQPRAPGCDVLRDWWNSARGARCESCREHEPLSEVIGSRVRQWGAADNGGRYRRQGVTTECDVMVWRRAAAEHGGGEQRQSVTAEDVRER